MNNRINASTRTRARTITEIVSQVLVLELVPLQHTVLQLRLIIVLARVRRRVQILIINLLLAITQKIVLVLIPNLNLVLKLVIVMDTTVGLISKGS